MADSYTEALRLKAAHWSLAGDKQLLDVLQGLHQKIVEKCEETNRNLDKMVTALDEASVHLQNTNNKFTALSNSQFIESRVYDDDVEALADPDIVKEQPNITSNSEADNFKHSLQVLENMHETVTILCDSDSDSGTDGDDDIARVVLKPKDQYADRPLPYIIGSRPWKNKWHVGLVVEDSDTDSASVKDVNNEEYSDSEPEPINAMRDERRSPTISSRSSLDSENEQHEPSPPSQADLAAELARRLAGDKPTSRAAEPSPPSPVVRKVYKPHQPLPGAVFLDEPPPLDMDQSEESDDDIFAEINKKQPYRQSDRVDNSVAEDLFGLPGFIEEPPALSPIKQKQALFDEESEPELFTNEKPLEVTKEQENSSKKPVGGMSLFGSNANAEIGAAILKRNQRRSPTSSEESGSETTNKNNTAKGTNNGIVNEQVPKNSVTKEQTSITTDKVNIEKEIKTQKDKERDIFEDLFAKSERINRENKKVVREEKKEQTKPVKKVDLFSDNIFDDIDDIFTTNIKVAPKNNKKEQKSLFDDDDDLFTEKTTNNANDAVKTNTKETTKIFDHDIFSDEPAEVINEPKKNENTSFKQTKGLFDDSDDDLFADVDKTVKNVPMPVSATKSEIEINIVNDSKKTVNVEKGLFSDDDDLIINKKESALGKETVVEETPKSTANDTKIKVNTSIKPIVKSPDLFDDDDDDGMFLFQSNQKKPKSKDGSLNALLSDSTQLSNTTDTVIKEENFSAESTGVNDVSSFEDISSFKSPETRSPKVFESNEKENHNFEKLDESINQKTITTAKPNLAEKPVIENVIVNTEIEVKPKIEAVSVIPESVNETNVDSTKTVKQDVTSKSVATSNVPDHETEILKPDIAQKPALAKKPTEAENISVKNDIQNTALDNMKEVDANKNITESIFDDINNDDWSSITEKKHIDPPDIKTDPFSDIFNDQPPVFEKPKEPKRSKNVNALFDDDSDDESLFFKKNDVISDEKPELFTSSSDNKLFGLFIDEPPAIDVDFVQKPKKVDRLPKLNEDCMQKDDYLSENYQDHVEVEKSSLSDKSNISYENKNTFGNSEIESVYVLSSCTEQITTNVADNVGKNNVKYKNIFSDIADNIFEKPIVEDDIIFKTDRKDKLNIEETKKQFGEKIEIENDDISESSYSEPKKVGKLKPMNFNINVSTLLPGASPKKVAKSNDNTDGQVPSRSNDELYTNEAVIKDKFEPKLTKSLSFDENANSAVLDNKLSKERAKIQVKRRPSTRRARREAVKVSGINFGEDSTDNSSSIDDQPKTSKFKNIAANKETIAKGERGISHINIIPPIEADIITLAANDKINIPQKEIQKPQITLEKHIKDINVFDSDENLSNSDSTASKIKSESSDQSTGCKPSPIANVADKTNEIKSKVVYVLNDEDIFDTKSNQVSKLDEPRDIINKNAKTENIFDDKEHIFAENESREGITTLGQVYKETKTKPAKLDILSDSDDDNLFKTSTSTKQTSQVEKKQKTAEKEHVEVKNVPLKSKNKPLLSSFGDSDDELFKSKNKPNLDAKQSLFGSDSDEDLFGGVKKDKTAKQKVESKNVEQTIPRKEFKNLSLFEDEGDDLFGVKPKRNELKPETKQPAVKELTKPPEPVFEDPLSLGPDDDDY